MCCNLLWQPLLRTYRCLQQCLIDRKRKRGYDFLLEKDVLFKKWHDLPVDLQQDVDFAREALHLVKDPHTALEAMPSLCKSRPVWDRLLGELSHPFRYHHLDVNHVLGLAPSHMLADRELMMKACSRGASDSIHFHRHHSWRLIDIGLLADEAFFAHLLEHTKGGCDRSDGPLDLSYTFKHSFYRQFAGSLVASSDDNVTQMLSRQAVKNCFPQFVNSDGITYTSLVYQIHPEVWTSHQDVTIAWFQAGLPWCIEHDDAGLIPSKEIVLLIVEHCTPYQEKVDSFVHCCHVNGNLWKDWEFLKQVLVKCPSLYFSFDGATVEFWRDDVDMASLVIANLSVADHLSHWRRHGDKPLVQRLHRQLRDEAALCTNLVHIKAWAETAFMHPDNYLWGEIDGYLSKRRAEEHHTRQQAHSSLKLFLSSLSTVLASE